jgi:16S rRNA (uracil1498-N3)-methyltransferase
MHRVRVDPDILTQEPMTLPRAAIHYITRVLRLHVGDEISAFDGTGREYWLRLTHVSPTLVQGERIAFLAAAPAPKPLVLGQGLPKGAKFDFVVEKGSELGLTSLVPLYTERTVVRDTRGQVTERLARWQRIAEAAARQCGRQTLLEVCPPIPLADFCVQYHTAPVKIVCWEEEQHQGLRQVLERHAGQSPVVVLVGPEGGLTAQEVAVARSHGFVAVNLGPRLLRTETAAIAITSIVCYSLGDLEPPRV